MTQPAAANIAAEAGPVLPSLDGFRRLSLTEQIYQALHERIIDLTLPPGARISEAEVAAQMGVSRQPVRDAFFRLSELKLIHIRPQRATTVSLISPDAVLRAAFVRTALEVACVEAAATRLGDHDLDALRALLAQQQQALEQGDRRRFHALDDRMHREICERAGLGFAWTLIRENKGHMDRVRFLSLSFGTPAAFEDHQRLIAALVARDGAAAAAVIRPHIGRIGRVAERIRGEHPEMFEPVQ